MSFTLKQVTQRASGGEIVRTRVIAKTEILIGRGTECDLQLPDLAVSLRHARMVQTGGGRVLVEAIGEATFEANGKFVARIEIDLAQGARLVFGAHALTLSRGAELTEVVVNVARLEPAEVPETLDAAVRALAPGSVGVSKRGLAWTLGLTIVAACLVWPISAFFLHQNARIHADQQWSSGPLSHAHAFLGRRCEACHQQAFVAVRDEACLTCHRAGENTPAHQRTLALVREWGGPVNDLRVGADHAKPARLMRATPLPADWGGKIEAVVARAFNHPDTRCASCHREHMQAGGRIPTSHSRMADVPDKPVLTPTHDCVDCHAGLKSRLPDTDLVDSPSWRRHPDFRPLVAVSLAGPRPTLARVALRPGLSDRTGLVFSHQQHLSATNGVARMAMDLGSGRGYGAPLACASCHRPQGKGFQPVEMTRDCGACHSLAYGRIGGELKTLPHGHPEHVAAVLRSFYASRAPGPQPAPGVLPFRLPGPMPSTEGRGAHAPPPASVQAAAALRAAFSKGGACYGCHTILPPAPSAPLVWRVAPVRLSQSYLPRGGFDHGLSAHAKTADGKPACDQCHAAAKSDHADDLLIPAIAKCADCHGKTKAETPAAAGADCAECHGYHAPGRPQAPSSLPSKAVAANARNANGGG